MKPFTRFTYSCALSLCLFSLCARGHCQPPAAASDAASDSYLQIAVATVGSRCITRGEVTALYLDHYPDPKASSVEVCHRIFEHKDPNLEPLIQDLMGIVAMEVAAAQRHIVVSADEIKMMVHDQLEQQRQEADLPDMPDMQLALKLKMPYGLLCHATRRSLLAERLTRSDLVDQLEHEPRPEDFYSAHLIIVQVQPAAGSHKLDWDAARSKAEGLRAEILAGRRTFEEVARVESDNPTRTRGGAIGVLPRTVLLTPIDAALMPLNPGEITLPVRIKNGFALARLDRRGTQLTERDRQNALTMACSMQKRVSNAMKRVLKDISWCTTIGKPPEWLRAGAPE